jgi:L-seryl-tRNA(Ser) seleniumtransferase
MSLSEKYGFRKVINTRGPATVLGAARVCDSIRSDIYEILGDSAEIWELQRIANEKIRQLTGAEAGCAVHCSSAGLAIATAAALTGNNPARIKTLPDITWQKRKVVIQKGQVTGAGDCPIWQVIKITGADYVEIGEALDCATFHLEAALDENVAAAFYILEDTFAPNLLPLETFISICHKKGVPVICDAAYLTDFKMLAKLGVDMAIYSGQKWLGGCTSGIIAGRKDLIHACFLQEMGIGRPMKVGKEGIISIVSSIDNWIKRDHNLILSTQTTLANRIISKLDEIPGFNSSIVFSQFSPSVRIQIKIDASSTGTSAALLNDVLGKMNPVIKVDDYFVNDGVIIMDMAYVEEGDCEIIADYFIKAVTIIKNNPDLDTHYMSAPQTRQDSLYNMFNSWMDENPRGEIND